MSNPFEGLDPNNPHDIVSAARKVGMSDDQLRQVMPQIEPYLGDSSQSEYSLSDIPVTLSKGAMQANKMVVDTLSFLGNKVNPNFSKDPSQPIMFNSPMTGPVTITRGLDSISDFFDRGIESGTAVQSDRLQAEMSRPVYHEGTGEWQAPSIGQVAGITGETLPMLPMMAGTGGAVARGLQGVGVGARTATMAGYGLPNAALIGGDTYGETKDAVHQDLAKNNTKNLSEQEIDLLAEDVAQSAGNIGAGVGLVTGALGLGIPAVRTVSKPASGLVARTGNAGLGAFTEGVSEFVEEGVQGAAVNAGRIEAGNQNVDLMDGVIDRGAKGMIGGAAMGGTFGAMNNQAEWERVKPQDDIYVNDEKTEISGADQTVEPEAQDENSVQPFDLNKLSTDELLDLASQIDAPMIKEVAIPVRDHMPEGDFRGSLMNIINRTDDYHRARKAWNKEQAEEKSQVNRSRERIAEIKQERKEQYTSDLRQQRNDLRSNVMFTLARNQQQGQQRRQEEADQRKEDIVNRVDRPSSGFTGMAEREQQVAKDSNKRQWQGMAAQVKSARKRFKKKLAIANASKRAQLEMDRFYNKLEKDKAAQQAEVDRLDWEKTNMARSYRMAQEIGLDQEFNKLALAVRHGIQMLPEQERQRNAEAAETALTEWVEEEYAGYDGSEGDTGSASGRGIVGDTNEIGSAGNTQLAEQPNQVEEGSDSAGPGDIATGIRQAGPVADGRSGNDDALNDIDAKANEAATSPTNDLPEPTEAQKEAGNYKKGKVRLHGMDISIENPKGSTRSGTDANGKKWQTKMQHHYGDIKGTKGADGDSIDTFIGESHDSQKVFVVDQVDPESGAFDEHKVMLGFDNVEDATKGYQSNYDKGWKGLGAITETTVDEFKQWMTRPRKSKQPYALPVEPKPTTTKQYGVSVSVPKISKSVEDAYNRTTHIGKGRDFNAELNAAANDILTELNEKDLLDTPERQAKAKEQIEKYLNEQAQFIRRESIRSQNNPSWAVTGRGNMDTDKYNKRADKNRAAWQKDVDKLDGMRKRIPGIVEAVMNDQQRQAKTKREAVAKKLSNRNEVARMVGTIAGDVSEGKMELAKETRKWANKKIESLLDGMPKDEAKDLIGTIEQSIQKQGGIINVVGQRSNLAKKINAILGEQTKQAAPTSPHEQRQQFWDRFNQADETLTVADAKAAMDAVLNNETQIKEFIGSHTVPQIKDKFYRGWHDSGMRKDDLVDTAYEQMVTEFGFIASGDGTMTLSGIGRKSRFEGIKQKLDNLTDAQLIENMKARKASVDQSISDRKARLNGMQDPQTLEDFRNAVRAGLSNDFTPEQWAQYDRLHADERLAEQAQRETRQVTAVDGEVNYDTHETTHSKKGHDIYVVSLNDRVERDLYAELNIKAKQLGGYYSSYNKQGAIPGFQFRTEEARTEFLKVLDGENVEKTKVAKDKTSHLQELADRIEERANEVLGASRKTNTAKRAREAGYAIGNAEAELQKAAELRAISDAIQSGTAKYIAKMSNGTERDLLASLWSGLRHNAPKELVETRYDGGMAGGLKWKEGVSPEQKVRAAEYPLTRMYPDMIKRVAEKMAETKGYTMAGKKLLADAQTAMRKDTESRQRMYLGNHKHFGKFREFIKENADNTYFEEVAKDFNRLQRLGITSLPMLRAALLEYNEIASNTVPAGNSNNAVKQQLALSKFQGQYKEKDFFNSTPVVVKHVMEHADIEEGMSVFEPSAGVGSLADAAANIVGKSNVDTNELASGLREYLSEQGYRPTSNDFLTMNPERTFTFGDVFEAPDGTRGIMRGSTRDRVRLVDENGDSVGPTRYYTRSELVGVEKRGIGSGYDRIIMNPPFSKGQEARHVAHAYRFLKPGGRLVAVTSSMAGERSNKTDSQFREWLDNIAADEYPLPEGAFKEAINSTNVNAKIIVINKPANKNADIEPPLFTSNDPNQEQTKNESNNINGLNNSVEKVANSNIRFNKHDRPAKSGVTVKSATMALSKFLDHYKGLNDEGFQIRITGTKPRDMFPAANLSERDSRAIKGGYDKGTNTVFIFPENHQSIEDVRQTIREELLVHKGLGVFSQEEIGRLISRINDTRNSKAKRVREIWEDVESNYAGLPPLVQAEEFLGKVAQKRPSFLDKWMNKLLAQITKMFRSIGLYRQSISLSEMRSEVYRIGELLAKGKTPDNKAFDTQSAVDAGVRFRKGDSNRGLKKAAREKIDNMMQNFGRKAVFKMLPINQMADIYDEQYTKGHIGKYYDLLEAFGAYKAKRLSAIDEDTETRWDAMQKEKPDANIVMSRTMINATMAQMSPDKTFDEQDVVIEIEEKISDIANNTNPTERQSAYLEDLQNTLNDYKEMYQQISDDWRWMKQNAPEAIELYKDVRQEYLDTYNETKRALMTRIAELQTDENTKKQLMALIKLEFEKRIQKGDYFPLMRNGDFAVIARKGDEYVREHFESAGEAKEAQERYESLGFTVARQQMASMDNNEPLQGYAMGAQIIGRIKEMQGENIDSITNEQIEETLGNVNQLEILFKTAQDQVEASDLIDAVYQEMLRSLPNASAAKRFIHRNRTKGASNDSRRAFANTMLHSINRIAKIKYEHKFAQELAAIRNIADESSGDGQAVVRQIHESLRERNKKTLNPNGKPLFALLSGVGFNWLLGGSIAAGAVNLSQVPLVTFPYLSSKYGNKKAMGALASAYGEMKNAGVNVKRNKQGKRSLWRTISQSDSLLDISKSRNLTEQEARILNELADAGKIDLTQMHSMAQIADTEMRDNHGFRLPFTNKSINKKSFVDIQRAWGFFFHNAEVVNRQVTALASIRLAKEQNPKLNDNQLSEIAAKAIDETQFNYASYNRGMWAREDFGKIALMFMTYTVNIITLMAKNTRRMFAGDAEARKFMVNMMGAHFLAAGAIGLPLVEAVGDLLFMLKDATDDDDEPDDFKKWMDETIRQSVTIFGGDPNGDAAHMASTITRKGIINGLTGINVADRVGLNNLIWRSDNNVDSTGTEVVSNMLMGVSPIFSIAANIMNGAQRMGAGLEQNDDELFLRGVQGVVPKAVGDLAKAYRQFNYGESTLLGTELISPQEISAWNALVQATGFSNEKVRDMYERRSTEYRYDKLVAVKKQTLIRLAANAIQNNEDMESILERIAAFNEANPGMAITPDTIRRHILAKARRQQQTIDGIYTPKSKMGKEGEMQYYDN